ncbi:MAG: mechanosensitive ion channel [Nitrospinaceae bacterium]|nr:mechanosensitive ion channel [Nitrospinaceae bacterium]
MKSYTSRQVLRLTTHIRSLIWLGILLTLLLPLTSHIAPVGAAPVEATPAGAVKSSPEEIKALIEKIESPEKRAGLLSDLKILLQAIEDKKRGTEATSPVYKHFYAGLIQKIDDALSRSFGAFRNLPQKIDEIGGHLSTVAGEGPALWGFVRLAVAIALSLLLLLALRRASTLYLPHKTDDSTADLGPRIGIAVKFWLERAVPPAILLLAGSLLVILFGLGQVEENLLLIFLWSLFLERSLVAATRALLSPARPKMRIFPLADDVAGLCSIWVRRFIEVAVWGEAIAQTAGALGLGPDAETTLTIAYRFVIVLQAMALTLQYRGSVRRLLSALEPDNAGGALRAAIAAWNIVASRWHFIALPYLLILFSLWATDSREGVQSLITATATTAIIIAAAYGAGSLVGLAASRLFTISARLKTLVPSIDQRANRYTPLITRSINGIIWVGAFLFVLDAWGIPTIEALLSRAGVTLIATLAEIIITVALAILFIEGAHAAVEYFLNGRRDHQGSVIEPSPHQRTLLPLAYSAVKWVVIAVAGIILLASLGVNIAPVLAGAGILGLAIGFGAQSLVKDIITGVFMLIENNIAIGDIVRVKDIGGTVESFSLRSVKLRDYDGNVHVIPNSVIDVVTNFTKEYSRAVFEVGVAYREDADRVMGVIRQVGDEMAQDPEWGDQILEPVEIAGLERFDDSAIVIRGRFKTKPIKQWGVRREFNRRIKIAFDAMSIEIPFPYRTLTWAQEAPEPPEGSTIPPTPIATRGTGDADGDSD